MKTLYLLAAVAGAVVPYVFFTGFFASHGLDLPAFLRALFANGAAGGFSADLLISSLVFWLFMAGRSGPAAWPFVLVNLTIGLSCALPAYLYVCERRAGLASVESRPAPG